MVNNAEWLRPLDLLTFLRDVGKHFTLSYMLQKESVKSRLVDGISYTEFSYMLLQAYDFLELYRRHGCELQMGGSDQWGNITAGRELIRRVAGAEVHGVSAPLLTTSSGGKFGKSEQGAIWLDAAKTSPYRFHQFWVNSDDREVEALLRAFTFFEREAIVELMDRHARDPAGRIPHRVLADDVTTRVHGADDCRRARDASRVLFGELDPRTADAATWRMLADALPTHPLDLATPKRALDVVAAAEVCKSNAEARRLLSQGGIFRNGQAMTLETMTTAEDVLPGGYVWLRRGKKTDVLLITQPT
jgi:tyrosyl-tRNA synthetase